MTDTVSYILGVALSGAIGYILGTITHYRYMRVHGRSIIVPYIPAKGKGVTALLLVLALAVTGTAATRSAPDIRSPKTPANSVFFFINSPLSAGHT